MMDEAGRGDTHAQYDGDDANECTATSGVYGVGRG